MPVDEEYELLPHEEVEKLRKDVERLKKNPLGEGKDSKDLITAIHDLRHAIETLYQVFSQANQEMIHDYRSTSIKEHFTLISKQNQHIAEGILSVANMLQTAQQSNSTFQDTMPQQPMQQPPQSFDAQSNPPPSSSSESFQQQSDLPPLPSSPEQFSRQQSSMSQQPSAQQPINSAPFRGSAEPDPSSIIPDSSGLIGDPISSRAAFEQEQMLQSSGQQPPVQQQYAQQNQQQPSSDYSVQTPPFPSSQHYNQQQMAQQPPSGQQPFGQQHPQQYSSNQPLDVPPLPPKKKGLQRLFK